MAIKKVSEIGSAVIRSRSKAVSNIVSPRVRKIITDLRDTMRKEDLVGMAAPQIGIGERIFVTEVRKTKTRNPKARKGEFVDSLRVFINPKLVKTSKKMAEGYEGCGSIVHGGLFGPVKRPESVTVYAHDEKGQEFALETGGLLARIIQHEIDHLNGICFIDHVKDTRRLTTRDEYIKSLK